MKKAIRVQCHLVIAAALLFAVSAVAPPALAADYAGLGKRLRRLAGDPPGRGVASVFVADVETGDEIYSLNADKQMNPASNMKIVTAACALKLLGPEFKFATSLHGKVEGYAVRGPLFLKGHADPTLSTSDLWELAQKLRQMGVRRIEGGIVVDDSYFDSENLPYAYDQQPNEDAGFRAPVGAVSLNHNTIGITIAPSSSAMRPARLLLDPSDYAVVTNDTLTVGEGSHNPKISSQSYTDRTKIRVWGQVPVGSRPVTYFRRADNPSLLAGYGLKSVLTTIGIHVGGGVQVGSLPPAVPMVAEHLSEPLSEVLLAAGKNSNNFVTEMVLKTIGAELRDGPGTWEAALESAAGVLAQWELEQGSYTYRNGSGLFDANRISARQFVSVLRHVYHDPAIRPEFLSQLAVGGIDGTIRSRYQGKEAKRYIRAKTGTLDSVSTLTGYVMGRDGRSAVAFSILVNEAAGYVSSTRAYQEKIVSEIAKHLNGN